MSYPKVEIKKEIVPNLQAGSLWVFSGAILNPVNAMSGNVVEVYSQNEKIGYGYYSKGNSIAIKMVSLDKSPDDITFWKERISKAYNIRNEYFSNILKITNCYRLLNSEGDSIPGLIIDKYDRYLSLQVTLKGVETHLPLILKAIKELNIADYVILRKDLKSREREGLEVGDYEYISLKTLEKEEINDLNVVVIENDIKFQVNLLKGQKTGMFLDQREKRELVRKFSKGKRVLNLFSYTSGFGTYAMMGEAKDTLNIDESEIALKTGKINYELNDLAVKEESFKKADIFEYIKEINLSEFDLIVLDPPALTKSKELLHKATKAYAFLNGMAIKNIKSGGLLLTCSCSNFYRSSDFENMLIQTGRKYKRRVKILETLGHDFDHMLSLEMKQLEYLKCYLLLIE